MAPWVHGQPHLNRRAVTHAKALIEGGRAVFDSEWNEAQPSAEEENEHLDGHVFLLRLNKATG